MKTKSKILFFALLICASLNVDAQLGTKNFKKSNVGNPLIFASSNLNGTILASKGGNVKPVQLTTGINIDKILRNSETGIPFFIQTSNHLKAMSFLTPEQKSKAFLKQLTPLLGLDSPETNFAILSVQTDEYLQTHVKIEQQFKGISVYGSEAYIHLSEQNSTFHGSFAILNDDLTNLANVSKEEAVRRVETDILFYTILVDLNQQQKSLLDYTGPQASLNYFKSPVDQQFHLCYRVDIRPNFKERWIYFVDAASNKILDRKNNTQYEGDQTVSATDLNNVQRSIHTYLKDGTYYMMDASIKSFDVNKSTMPDKPVGGIWTIDAKNTKASDIKIEHITSQNNTNWTKTAVSAHYGATTTYNFFENTFKRKGLDGKGGTIISIINVIDEDGNSLENAFWNGKAMFFGNGGNFFKPLAGGLDVVAHELGHGVIENTANLEYQDQAGALNESFADISGVLVDNANWTMGEAITKKTSTFPLGILRDLSDPHNGSSEGKSDWQPKHMSEFYSGKEDNGGVHINSGIPNYAFYLFANANGMTKSLAGEIYYKVLSNYLTKYATFTDLRVAVLLVAKSAAYASNPKIAVAASAAFDGVGIFDPGTVPANNTDLQASTTQGILIYDLNGNISISNENGSVIESVYPFPAYRCSVSDNGKVMVFVGEDRKIRKIDLTVKPYVATIIHEDTIFRSLAISKDGTHIAAARFKQEASIWVATLSNKMIWTEIKLFNPTTGGSNVKTAGVVAPDVLEWDYTGEKIVYDAFNVIKNNNGSKIEYWDVGIISIWDNATNAVKAKPIIQKLVSSLPQFVSMENPTFSKTSPNIIAFDYLYEGPNETGTKIYDCKVLGYNILTDSLAVISEGTTLGYPSFNANDTKLIFATKADADVSDNNLISEIGLNASKFNVSSSASTEKFKGATSAIYYNTQARQLGTAPVANFQIVRKSTLGVFYQYFIDQSKNKPTSWLWTIDGPLFGSLYITGSEIDPNPIVSFLRDGTYTITLKVTNKYGTNSMSKTINISPQAVVEFEQNKVNTYPNPFNDQIKISADKQFEKESFYSLTDLSGRLITKGSLEFLTNVTIPTSNLAVGVYILNIFDGKESKKQKMIKE